MAFAATYGETAIAIAAQRGHWKVVRALKVHTSPVSREQDQFYESLAAGDEAGALNTLERNPKLTESRGARYPLLRAAMMAKMKRLASYLLKPGDDYREIMPTAVMTHDEDILVLIAGKNQHIWNDVLYYAAESGHLNAARIAIAHGADVNAKSDTPSKRTALDTATATRHDQIAQLLLDHGAHRRMR